MDPLERASFIHHIAECPDERAPRLVFADWLEERAESLEGPAATAARARAEFVRTECEMVRQDHLYPPVSPRLARCRELSAEFESAWLAELPPWAEVVDGFHRGFATDIRARAADLLAHGDELAALTPLNRLRVVPTGPGSLLALAGAAWWKYVRALRIERVRWADPWLGSNELEEFVARADLCRLVLLRWTMSNQVPVEIEGTLRRRFGVYP